MALFLKTISDSQIKEYPDTGHESDVLSVTYKGITIIVEIIWSLSKSHIYSDFLILSNSFANVKLLIINHEFFSEKNKDKYKGVKREYDKLRISEIRKGYIISEPFDSNLVMSNKMDDIKNFLDYSIVLLSSDNMLYDKHLTDLKNYIITPLVSFLNTTTDFVDIEQIQKIGNQELFYDYLKHFDLESRWKAFKHDTEKRLSLIRVIQSEFRNFCNQNNIPVTEEIKKISYYGIDTYPKIIDNIPVKDFIERLLILAKDPSFESVLDTRLTIEKYPSENVIKFRMHVCLTFPLFYCDFFNNLLATCLCDSFEE